VSLRAGALLPLSGYPAAGRHSDPGCDGYGQRPAGAGSAHPPTLIREGQSLSSALQQCRLTTPVSVRMLRAGEQAGNLGQMIERTADLHDEQIARWIDWFVRLFEPLLMTFIGLLIGTIVILMYIPIFELASSIQ